MNKYFFKSSALVLILITLLGLFFYAFRLKDTQVFTDDTARDTLKALQIWQSKELTLIGAPASFSVNTIREVYFGSVYLYIGILGLIIANWDPIGAVFPNTVLFTLSIPLFYLFVLSHSKDRFLSVFAVLLYTLSPITVIHSRFFWNPNLIIPLSVLFWYLITQKAEGKKKAYVYSFSSGLIAGIMFNFHYIIILPIFVFLLIIFMRQRLKSILAMFGLVVASLPIIIFELRNSFYLTKSFWFNLFGQQSDMKIDQIPPVDRWDRFINIFEALMGLRPAEIDYPTLINYNQAMFIAVTLLMIGIVMLKLKEIKKYGYQFLIPLSLSLAATIYFSFSKDLLIRYMFAVYPLFILLVAKLVYVPRFKYLSLIILVPVIYSSVGVLYDDPKLGKGYLPLGEIEQACRNIVQDLPVGRYNVTENIRGDARAMAFRYCLAKDAKIKPQNEFTYEGLSALYVISPSLEKTYREKRWEFVASGPWKLSTTNDIGSVYLYKFIK